MVVKLSSKGQLIIPKEIRRALNLQPGTTFDVKLVDDKIILQPVMDKVKLRKTIDAMRQLAAGPPLLDELEKEHRHELDKDVQL
jgi:AbrB family looped-hinge helix DNA binding protein